MVSRILPEIVCGIALQFAGELICGTISRITSGTAPGTRTRKPVWRVQRFVIDDVRLPLADEEWRRLQ